MSEQEAAVKGPRTNPHRIAPDPRVASAARAALRSAQRDTHMVGGLEAADV